MSVTCVPYTDSIKLMVGVQGIEPWLPVPKTGVIPLYHTPKTLVAPQRIELCLSAFQTDAMTTLAQALYYYSSPLSISTLGWKPLGGYGTDLSTASLICRETWSGWGESNPRHSRWQRDILASELHPQNLVQARPSRGGISLNPTT